MVFEVAFLTQGWLGTLQIGIKDSIRNTRLVWIGTVGHGIFIKKEKIKINSISKIAQKLENNVDIDPL
jgi:hypothetical protein